MIALGLMSWAVGIGLLCWVFFAPVSIVVSTMAGLIVFLWTYRMGAGFAAVVIGIAAGSLVLWLFRVGLTASRHPIVRLGIILAFCVPAVIAGYSTTLGIAEMGVPSSIWQHILAVIGAAAVSSASFARLTSEQSA